MGHKCKDCKERYLGCHDYCESYQKYRKKRNEINDRRLRERELASDDRLAANQAKKLKRKLGW